MSRHVLVSSFAAVAALSAAVLAVAPAASATASSSTAASVVTLDPSYAPNLTYLGAGPVIYRSAIAHDGSAFVAGTFSDVDGLSRTGIVHLLADGTVDPGFATTGTGLDPSGVDSMVEQPDGKVIVGSDFSTYDGQPVSNVIRLNQDGTLDTTFNAPDLAGRANGLGLQPDGKVLVGLSSGAPVRLNPDGDLDSSFHVTMTPQTGVNSFAVMANGDIYIGGAWDFLNGVEWRFGLARLNSDGSTDHSFDPRGQVSAGFLLDMHVSRRGTVIAGGRFTLAGSGSTSYLRTFDKHGKLTDGIGTVAAPGNAVTSVDVRRGKVFIGGVFTNVAGEPRGEIAELNSDGSLNANTFNGGADNGQVWLVDAGPKGSVLMGGSFSSVDDSPRSGLARFTKAS